MRRAALLLVAIALIATTVRAADAPAQAAVACAATKPPITDLKDDAAVLRGLYGTTQILHDTRVPLGRPPAELAVAATDESGTEEFRMLRERLSVLRDGHAAWLLILDSVPVTRDAQDLRVYRCADCRNRGYVLLLQACAGGWQPQGPAQPLATGEGFAAASSYRVFDLGRERLGILQQWGGFYDRRERQTLFALQPSGKTTRVLELLRRFEDDTSSCGMDAYSSKRDPSPCRGVLNRIEAIGDATAEWRPLRVDSRFLDEHGKAREAHYRLVFRNGSYQPETGELASLLSPDFASRGSTH